MKTNQLTPRQKRDLLTSAMQGNTVPLEQYREQQEKPYAYMVKCYQLLPADRLNTANNHLPDDRIIGIELTRSYVGGKLNETDYLPDMSRGEYDQWRAKMEASGSLVVGFVRTRRLARK